jgi:hypothetical protein
MGLRQSAGFVLDPLERAVHVQDIESRGLKISQVLGPSDAEIDLRRAENARQIDAFGRRINTDNVCVPVQAIQRKCSKASSPAPYVENVIARPHPKQIDEVASVRELGIADLIVTSRPALGTDDSSASQAVLVPFRQGDIDKGYKKLLTKP